MKLSIKDMKILHELDFNARLPITQIAKRIGLSPEVTSYRIKQLELKGIIKGYVPMIDISTLGYMFCRFRLIVENLNSDIEEKIISLAKGTPSIGWVIIAGNSTVGLVLYAKSMREAEKYYSQIATSFPTTIKSKEFSVAHRIYHFRRKYLYGLKDNEELIWGNDQKVMIDAIDREILNNLITNARVKYTELALIVKLTPMAVLNRIKRLKKEKLILGFRSVLDLQKLGYNHHKIYLFFQNITLSRKETLKEFLRQELFVVYITEAVGRSDLEFEMHVKTDHEVHDFINKLRDEFPEIKSFENTLFYREEIIRYFPDE